jgi:serine/threonine-protein kinase
MHDDLSGQILGKYHLTEKIGAGAMGAVYRAETPEGQAFAIKLLHSQFSRDADFRARFEREVRLMASLNHPHIMPVYDYGAEQHILYFVMPLVAGQTLSRLMRRRSFSPAFAWELLGPIAEALHFGHQAGVLHRDVKPGNVLLERHGGGVMVYLMDFGLAKRPGDDKTLTETGVSIGTPEYMSPEAALGQALDPRTDVYSFAVMLYELLLGVLPFDKGDAHLTALAQLNEPPPPMTQVNPHFPASLNAVVLRSLAKQPNYRHPDMRALAADFEQSLAGLLPEEQTADYWVI